jgi:hypothetical protein
MRRTGREHRLSTKGFHVTLRCSFSNYRTGRRAIRLHRHRWDVCMDRPCAVCDLSRPLFDFAVIQRTTAGLAAHLVTGYVTEIAEEQFQVRVKQSYVHHANALGPGDARDSVTGVILISNERPCKQPRDRIGSTATRMRSTSFDRNRSRCNGPMSCVETSAFTRVVSY